jgi:small GTP-binding protein
MGDKTNEIEDSIKIILLGESGVGKTNLINVFFGFGFDKNTETTLSSYCYDGEFQHKNKTYSYSIWDTAGQEKFRAINKMFIRDAKIIFIVYSIDNKYSFDEVDFWVNFVKENLGTQKYIMALVANKCDLYEDQMVMDDEGQNAANKYGIEFITTSAFTNIITFKNFVYELLNRYIEMSLGHDIRKNIVKINNDKKDTKQKKCCSK